MKKILVIQIKQIGDCLLTEPVFEGIKRTFPESETYFVVSSSAADIFRGNPFIDEVIPYDFKSPVRMFLKFFGRKFDIVFDFLGNPRSKILTFFLKSSLKIGFDRSGGFLIYDKKVTPPSEVEYVVATKMRFLEAVGIPGVPRCPRIYLKDEEKKQFEKFFAGGRRVVAISSTSRRPARRWLKENFAALCDSLIRRGFRIVFLWGPGEREYVGNIVKMMREKPEVSPELNLRQLAAFLSSCNLLITNCNGTRHIAAAVGTPTLTIHGPTHWKAWKPPGEEHRVLYSDVNCIFCEKKECGSMRCMKELKPEAVLDAASEMLNRG
ncbi:MAG: glycosyltransferase family 9 protein [Elusimicrobia bacterium]|nr:glycosyltransferase family 9 protein [Elusimicrobiota bacterium]